MVGKNFLAVNVHVFVNSADHCIKPSRISSWNPSVPSRLTMWTMKMSKAANGSFAFGVPQALEILKQQQQQNVLYRH